MVQIKIPLDQYITVWKAVLVYNGHDEQPANRNITYYVILNYTVNYTVLMYSQKSLLTLCFHYLVCPGINYSIYNMVNI